VIAHAVHETGRREIIGLDVGEAETEAFWREFLGSLVQRGLVGVQLAISDAHPGLKAAPRPGPRLHWKTAPPPAGALDGDRFLGEKFPSSTRVDSP
jgi:Transposase, Mutator family